MSYCTQTIIFIRDKNSKGQEISGYIDYSHRLKVSQCTLVMYVYLYVHVDGFIQDIVLEGKGNCIGVECTCTTIEVPSYMLLL